MDTIKCKHDQSAEKRDEIWAKPMWNYNQNSSLQAKMNTPSCKILTQQSNELSRIFIDEFHLADFGCSHGKNSMECIKAAFDGYQANPSSIRVYLNDLSTNDFGEVFKCLNDPAISYTEHPLALRSPVSTCVNGKSFYTQCFPSDHLHLAFSFNCLQYMDKPVTLSRAITTTSPRVTPDEAEALATNAHLQLVAFFESRAKELKQGGRVVASFVKAGNLLDSLDEHFLAFVEKRGYRIEDFASVAIPVYDYSDDEVKQALNQLQDKFRVLFLDSTRTSPSEMPVQVLRSITYNALLHGLKTTKLFNSIADCEAFIESFYASFDVVPLGAKLHTLVLERL